MWKPSVLILGEDAKTLADVSASLKDVATVKTEAADALSLGSAARHLAGNPSAVLVNLGFDPTASFQLVSELSGLGARVIVVSPTKDPDQILQAMRAGAREFVIASDQTGLRRAVREQAKPPEASGPRGTITVLFPTRGGVGATTIAANLAGALQRRGSSACLLDLDLHLGDVLSFLDLPGTYSITDVLANLSRLDKDLLEVSVARHPSGVRVLAQSGKVEEAEHVRASDVPALLDFLRRSYDHVVVDGVRGFDEMSLAVLDAGQRLIMVMTQDVPAVRNAKRCLDLFHRLGYADDKIQLILNRYQKDSKITPEVIADTVGIPVAHALSNDFGAAIESINRGLLLFDAAPRSRLTKDIEALAPLLLGDQGDGARRRGFFRGLLGKSKKDEDGAEGAS